MSLVLRSSLEEIKEYSKPRGKEGKQMTNFGIIVKIQGKNVIVVSEAGLFEMIKYRENVCGQKIFTVEKT